MQTDNKGYKVARFIVDFELAGHVEVEAEDEKEAIDKVSEMPFEHLAENVETFNVGKNYVELSVE